MEMVRFGKKLKKENYTKKNKIIMSEIKELWDAISLSFVVFLKGWLSVFNIYFLTLMLMALYTYKLWITGKLKK